MSAPGGVRALFAAIVVASCADLTARGRAGSDEALAGWRALAEGRRPTRRRRSTGGCAAPRDPIALFRRASIDYERGASRRLPTAS